MAVKAKDTNTIEIKPIETETMKVTIEGDTSFICHAWSQKAIMEMLGKQSGEVANKRAKTKEPRKPFSEFLSGLYWITEKPTEETEEAYEEAIANGARFGFPVTAIKQAMGSAAYRRGWIENKMALRGGVFIAANPDGLVEVKYPKNNPPKNRLDMVKIGNGSTSDLRYRPEFQEWSIDLEVTYDTGLFTASQVINFLNAAGFMCGIGEWRPEKDGQFGMFHVKAN